MSERTDAELTRIAAEKIMGWTPRLMRDCQARIKAVADPLRAEIERLQRELATEKQRLEISMNLVDIAQNSTEAAQQSTIEIRRELAEANRKLELSRELGKAMAVTADDLDRKLRINTLRDKEIAGLRAAFVSGKITAK